MSKPPVPASARRGLHTAKGLAVPVIFAALGSSAYAQAAAPAAGGGITEILTSLMPILLLVVIFWLLIFRPQQKRMKAQQAMLSAIRRGDTVVTTGGIVGKVTKAVDGEDLEVEIAQGVKVKLVRGMISDVRSKAEPVNDNAKPA
jgi:preprotein translocase subunit YajC